MSYTQFWRRVGAEEDEEDAILLPRPAVKLSMDLPTMPLPQPRSSTPPVVVAPTTSTRSGFKFKKTLTAASIPASPSTTTSPSTPALKTAKSKNPKTSSNPVPEKSSITSSTKQDTVSSARKHNTCDTDEVVTASRHRNSCLSKVI